ncbi:MAG: hypothetical protein D3916_05215 [Candidatus Electrothrix sp. MAN1_4]|nr:hypothetical protein [Candidatus Electrothrix sp. MAN1_4]
MTGREETTDNEQIQLEFLYKAIEDTKGIIMMLDGKIGAALVFLILPFGKLSAIEQVIHNLWHATNCVVLFPVVVLSLAAFFLCYALAVYFGYSCVFARSNPVQYIDLSAQSNSAARVPEGTFYLPQTKSLVQFPHLRTGGNRILLKIKPTYSELLQRIQGYSAAECRAELTLEFMKLVAIREIKQKKQQLCFQFLAGWLVSSGVVYFLYWVCLP